MTKTPETPLQRLMSATCVTLGYCGSAPPGEESRHFLDRVPKEGTVTADEFVEWVLWADRHPGSKHRQQIRAAFVSIMGAEEVDARKLRFED